MPATPFMPPPAAAIEIGRPRRARRPLVGVASGAPVVRVAATSATATTARPQPARPASCTTRSTADATCSRIASRGSATSPISTIVSSRRSASAGPLAWHVDSDPS